MLIRSPCFWLMTFWLAVFNKWQVKFNSHIRDGNQLRRCQTGLGSFQVMMDVATNGLLSKAELRSSHSELTRCVRELQQFLPVTFAESPFQVRHLAPRACAWGAYQSFLSLAFTLSQRSLPELALIGSSLSLAEVTGRVLCATTVTLAQAASCSCCFWRRPFGWMFWQVLMVGPRGAQWLGQECPSLDLPPANRPSWLASMHTIDQRKRQATC